MTVLVDNLDTIFVRSFPATTTTGDILDGVVVVGFVEAVAAAFLASNVARRNAGDKVGNLTRGGVGNTIDCVGLLGVVVVGKVSSTVVDDVVDTL